MVTNQTVGLWKSNLKQEALCLLIICILGLLYLMSSSASLIVCKTLLSDFSKDSASLVLLGVLLKFCIPYKYSQPRQLLQEA